MLYVIYTEAVALASGCEADRRSMSRKEMLEHGFVCEDWGHRGRVEDCQVVCWLDARTPRRRQGVFASGALVARRIRGGRCVFAVAHDIDPPEAEFTVCVEVLAIRRSRRPRDAAMALMGAWQGDWRTWDVVENGAWTG